MSWHSHHFLAKSDFVQRPDETFLNVGSLSLLTDLIMLFPELQPLWSKKWWNTAALQHVVGDFCAEHLFYFILHFIQRTHTQPIPAPREMPASYISASQDVLKGMCFIHAIQISYKHVETWCFFMLQCCDNWSGCGRPSKMVGNGRKTAHSHHRTLWSTGRFPRRTTGPSCAHAYFG